MAEMTAIEWADSTLNPWIGCQRAGPGCDNCYAEALSKARLGVIFGPGEARRRTVPATWNNARKWNRQAPAFFAKHGRRRRVFCASLADVFDNAVDPAWRHDLGDLIRETPDLDWLLLTKRIGNAPDMIFDMFDGDVPANFRVGATIVNQTEWNRDAGKIAAVAVLIGKARVFLSMEPLLGPVDLSANPRYRWHGIVGWVIVGGESGPGARPMHPRWAVHLGDQCIAAGVPFMFKQWGEWKPFVSMGDSGTFIDETGEYSGTRLHRFPDGQELAKVGKKNAGRNLFGRSHDGVPA